MSASPQPAPLDGEFEVVHDGVQLSGEISGTGPAVVLLHGLTATRRYVVMGSTALVRGGHRVALYDARGHGRSGAASQPDQYTYPLLADDLLAVMDRLGLERAVLAGASMGAHTLLNFALRNPDRVAGMVVITPAYDGGDSVSPARIAHWDALAEGLRGGGVDGFLAAYGNPHISDERVAKTVLTVIRQRLSAHENPLALADALQFLPRSRPFATLDELSELPDVPVVVVGSGDDADPEHPLAVAKAYQAAITNAELRTEEPGHSPLAWQGSQLSRIIAEVVAAS